MRNYKRKTNQRPLTEEFLKEAQLLMAEKQCSIREAARAIGFNESTLRKRLKSGQGAEALGRFRAVFTAEEESEVKDHCIALDKQFFCRNMQSLRFLLYSYAERKSIAHPFSKQTKLAGKDFTRSFLKRNDLSVQTPEKNSVAKTKGFNRQQLNQYFDNLQAVLQNHEFTPDRIYNMDDTGVQTVPRKIPKRVSPAGKREFSESVASEQDQTVTVVCCMNASGNHLPPYFIFGRKRMNRSLIMGGPTGCDMCVTDKGYMTTSAFFKWLEHFQKITKSNERSPTLLILGNQSSHISLEAITYAKNNHIHMLSLPPRSTHKTQPLDRAFFGRLKEFYNEAVESWKISHPQVMSISHVAQHFNTAFQKTMAAETGVEGFRVTGIFPFDRYRFTDWDFSSPEVFNQKQEDRDEEEEHKKQEGRKDEEGDADQKQEDQDDEDTDQKQEDRGEEDTLVVVGSAPDNEPSEGFSPTT